MVIKAGGARRTKYCFSARSAAASAAQNLTTALLQSHMHTWFNEPVAIEANGATYVGLYMDGGGVAVARHDQTSKIVQVGSPRLGTVQIDDHNNPAILRLSNGKILAAYSEHPGKCWASISPNADSVLGVWTETQLYDGATYYNSYAHLAQTTDDQNTIWWLFRHGLSGNRPITFRINQNGGAGASWTANASTVQLISNTGQRPYFRIAVSGRRIDILYTDSQPSEFATNSLYHMYLIVNQAGTQFSAYKADGTLIDTWAITGGTGTVNSTALPVDVSAGTKIYDGSTTRSWVWDAQNIGGTLYCCYATYSQQSAADDTHLYRRATYNGTSWTHENICYAGDSTNPATAGRAPQWIYPDADNSQQHYSPGICSDPATVDRVYLGKKYGNGDVRMQQWDKAGGVWSKTSDLSGATGNSRVNARPFPVLGSTTGNAIWFSASSYLAYTNFVTVSPSLVSPLGLINATKPTVPVYNSTFAHPGTKAMYLFTEGTGTAVGDVTGNFPATISGGSLTWGSDTYGGNLSGFSSTVAVICDALATSGFFNGTTFPKWIALLYKSTAATTGQYPINFGNSGSNNQMFAATVNTSTDNQVGGAYRDDALANNQIIASKTRDANYHTLMALAENASSFWVFSDGVSKGQTVVATSTATFNRFTIGALRRTSQSNPASGCVISAALAGSGSYPSPAQIHIDLMNAQFLGAF